GASTDSVCRSSRLIVIDADSSATIVQRWPSVRLPVLVSTMVVPSVRDGGPLPRRRGLLQRLEHPLNRKAVPEVGMKRGVVAQRPETPGERGDERVPVADDVGRTPEVREPRMLHVRDEDVAGALIGRRVVRVRELEMVQPLEIEAQHAARAVNLEAVRVA